MRAEEPVSVYDGGGGIHMELMKQEVSVVFLVGRRPSSSSPLSHVARNIQTRTGLGENESACEGQRCCSPV